MNNRHLFTYFLGFLSMVFWGFSFIWSKVCFEHLSPLSTIFFRLLLSVVVLFAYLILSRKLIRIRPKDRLAFLASGFFSPFLYFIGENYGLKLVTATTASVIIATIPLITPIAAALFLSERLSKLNIAGIMISFIGVLAMIITPTFELGASPQGIGLLFLAVFAATGYSLVIRNLSQHYPPIHIIAWQNLIGMALFLPWFLWFDIPKLSLSLFNKELIIALLQLAIFASSLAFILFVRLIREVGVSKASVMSNLIPVITAVASFYMLSEHFTLLKVIGISTVIGGVILTQIPKLGKKITDPEVCQTEVLRHKP